MLQGRRRERFDWMGLGSLPPPREFRLAPEGQALFLPQIDSAYYYVIWRPDGGMVERSTTAPEGVARPESEQAGSIRQVRNRGLMREVTLSSRRGVSVVVGRDIGLDLEELHRLSWWLLLAGVGVWLLGMGGGWWVATRAIAPIEEISSVAGRIAGGRLDQRIDLGETDSELGQLAGVLNRTFERLRSAFDRQAQFTADASHELRTPVAVILTQTQTLLKKERPAEEYRQGLEVCGRASERMRRVIESLLLLARLDGGGLGDEGEVCDLQHIIAETLKILSPLAVESRVELEPRLENAWCRGDAHLLGQVVMNLVSNAIVYNREGGRVEVSLGMEGEQALLTVRDDGAGIASEHLPHLFDRFYRVDKARARSKGHAGLGLAIVKSIVDAHGGRVEATSELGKGTTFAVRFAAVQRG
jgi:heavy metal sensor kinase